MLKIKTLLNKRVLVNRDDDENDYVSSVQEVEPNYIAIAIPYFRREPLLLHKNESVNIKLFGDGEFYIMKQRVIERRTGNVPVYLLSLPEHVQRVQQRSFVRIRLLLEVRYRENHEDVPKIGKTIDISGGGMKLAVTAPVEAGKEIFLSFNLPGDDMAIETKARVIRNEIHEIPGGKLKCLGLEFSDIPESVRDHIIAFIFSKMAQQRRQTN